ncbi:TadE/TadG family type IV pilus assembly protein [Occallatibacter savannae]|uniref:TadE/TadG family type IV pilus assembly protein n=1 Tax=Occallatibacter savannae TaxID=1002691 RepID=UPI000D6999A1|nr:TadE/TadG family type IV pilus assembly protein [Occallatibacter savannae]
MVLKVRSKFRSWRERSEEGSSLVEMALSCLILIPVLFGIIQMTFALYCYHYAADAAREATRFAIVRGANCAKFLKNSAYCSPTDGDAYGATGNDIAQYVKTLGYPYSATATTSVKWCTKSGSTWINCSTSRSNSIGNQVQVTVTYSYPFIVPFMKTDNPLNMGSVASMTIVQ